MHLFKYLRFLFFVISIAAFVVPIDSHAFETYFTPLTPPIHKAKPKQITSSFNVKIMPAFYWNSTGIEFEYVLKPNITFGANLIFKWGNIEGINTNFIVKPADYLKYGMGLDVFGRYYFDQTAPVGFYGQFNVSYSRMVFDDGNTRPFALIQQSRDFINPRTENDLKLPKPLIVGIGGGYQLPIIPKHRIIANVLLGIQGQFNSENSFFIAMYLAPSIGYMFK